MASSRIELSTPGRSIFCSVLNRSSLDVIVCTLDEEANLRMCLESVAWASTRFVVDAGSTDATTAIAGECGAELIAHPWTGYSDQKNWALENLPLRSEWVLFLDADERLPQDLADEIKKAIAEPADKVAGYYIARKMIFLGRWLRRTYWYPDYNLRLFRRGKGRFETRLVHERVVLTGPAGYLKSPLIHEDMRDLSTYVSRLNRYSTLEALEMYRRPDAPVGMRFTGSWFGDPAQRRRVLKESVWYRLPFRPTIRFLWTMIIRLGFLDGREGLIFTGLACMNEWLANVKLHELRLRESEGWDHPPAVMPALSGYRRPDPSAASSETKDSGADRAKR